MIHTHNTLRIERQGLFNTLLGPSADLKVVDGIPMNVKPIKFYGCCKGSMEQVAKDD